MAFPPSNYKTKVYSVLRIAAGLLVISFPSVTDLGF